MKDFIRNWLGIDKIVEVQNGMLNHLGLELERGAGGKVYVREKYLDGYSEVVQSVSKKKKKLSKVK